MKTLLLTVALLAPTLTQLTKGQVLPVTERNGRLYVSASSLAEEGSIAVKSLPGQNQWVACSGDRCALVHEVIREGDQALLGVSALAEALGAVPEVDEARRAVRLSFKDQSAAPLAGIAKVGQLAPNFRLAKLDGSPVALSDYRGKRVLINSWASW